MGDRCPTCRSRSPALLALRLRYRRNPEARALVDRALALVARAQTADEAAFLELKAETQGLADMLALRFGPPNGVTTR
jgi:hypothetical protein